MQQTTNYKLNLIETSDPFSPEALNKNTEAIDAELAAEKARVNGEIARVDGALLKFTCGTYVGDGTVGRFINLGFTPKVVYLSNEYGAVNTDTNTFTRYYGGLVFADRPLTVYGQTIATIVENGVEVSHYVSQAYVHVTANMDSNTHCYFAIG